ncbi:TlpA disulfide reductase family protein [Pedobacter sp. BAL39]|uniref:TlpA disulfide reductase family protein n=1 Tax=Pedobacter sp. BAL39 TaxID=391596 RepID=UPI0018DBE26E|nr:TlpA disulfide reductase family protein [Pedobacter sp. BAL39]
MKICLLGMLFICASALAQDKKYNVKGHLTDSKVPMKVFLSYRDGNRKVTDSTMSKNNKFSFSGTLEHATEASIYVHWVYPSSVTPEDPVSQGAEFMLDHGNTTIEGGTLFTATITGTAGQKEYVALNRSTDVLRDSVYQIWKTQMEALPEDSAAAFNRLLYAQEKIIKNAMKRYVKSHPQSAVSFNILQQNTIVVSDVPFVEFMLAALKPEFGDTKRYQEVNDKVSISKRLAIGQPALNFTQTDDKGKMVSFADVKGKYILIDFWASWCGPCRTEYPFLKRAYTKYKDKNLEIIGVSIDDDKSAWLNAIKSNGFQWIQLSDMKGRENAIAKMYGISAIPQSFLIDPQGKIIAKNLRGEDLLEKLAEVMP